MKKKYLNPDLHGTRGEKYHPPVRLDGSVASGSGFSRKVGMGYTYRNFNEKGKTNIIIWEGGEK